jgi:hypothetical protein
MNNISTKCIMYRNVPTMHNTHVHQPCTSTMCQKISSMKSIHHMPTMCIYQYPNMCIYQLCQSCASTNMPTMCIYQHAKQCIISLMICLHHEPSATIMYQNKYQCCENQVIPYMSVLPCTNTTK